MERKKTSMGSSFSTMAVPPTKESARTSRSQTGATVAETQGATGLVAASDVPAAEPAAAAESQQHISQCGLEDDEDMWEEAPLPQRIRISILSEQKKQKYQGFVDVIFSAPTLRGKRICYPPDDLYEVMADVVPYLESEPMLIEDVPFPCSIVGDVYGQLYDVHRVFLKNAKDGKPGWVDHKYVFLGDYVDRGRQSIEVLVALFCIKMLYPDNIFLLRGRHEFMDVNMRYGLLVDCFDRYTDEETRCNLYYRINKTFAYLSVAAIVGDAYLCVHGGISPSFFARRHFNSIAKPVLQSTEHLVIQDAIWSEPAIGLHGTTFNWETGVSHFYGLDATCVAMEKMNIRGIFRAHTAVDEGFESFYGVLFSIFTATACGGRNNKGAVAVIDEKGHVSFRVLEVDPKRVDYEKRLREYADEVEAEGCTTTFVEVTPEHEVEETGKIKKM